MNSKAKTAGDFIDSRCTKCKILTNHTIVAMMAERPVRVKCNTCHSEHNYHPPKVEKALTSQRSTVAKIGKPSSQSYQERWSTALARLDLTTAVPYDREGKYIKDMLINHLYFGFGVVTALSFDKMEVLFNDGPIWLRCC